jgi:hypothetical protein
MPFTVKVSATTTNLGGSITNVEFFRGTNFLGSDTSAPFEMSFSDWAAGTYSLWVRATDNAGQKRSTNAVITITPWQPRPLIGRWDSAKVDPAPGSASNCSDCYVTALNTDLTNRVYDTIYDSTGDGSALAGYWDFNSCTWSAVTSGSNGTGTGFCATFWNNGIVAGGSGLQGNAPNFVGGNGNLGFWDGTNWTALDVNLDFDSPQNESGLTYNIAAVANIKGELYVGGVFTNYYTNAAVKYLAKRSGTNWIPVGNGLNGQVRAIANIGDTLYVGGDFTSAGGNSDIKYIAKLVNGQWAAVGTGVSAGYHATGIVRVLASWGDNLYVGGSFSSAGGDTNAACLAKWDGKSWSRLADGYSSYQGPDNVAAVQALAIRGKEIFVGGKFTEITTADGILTVNNVAHAVWSEDRQKWVWATMDGGVQAGGTAEDATVYSLAVHDGSDGQAYEVFVGGKFDACGAFNEKNIARWMVGTVPCSDPAGISVVLNTPVDGDITNITVSLPLSATVATTGSVYSVAFLFDGVLDSYGLPDAMDTNLYKSTWTTVSGVHQLKVVATTDDGHMASAPPVTITVIDPGSPVIAVPNIYPVLNDVLPNAYQELANDTNGLFLAWAGRWSGLMDRQPLGSVSIGYRSTNVIYTPIPDRWGMDTFSYAISDASNNTAVATVTINVKARPLVVITSPEDGFRTNVNTVTISGTTSDPDGSVTNVSIYADGNLLSGSATIIGGTFSKTWTPTSRCWRTFVAVATDNEGNTNASYPVIVSITNTAANAFPVAQMTNLFNTVSNHFGLAIESYPTIREGTFDLRGRAYDPDGSDPVSYRVALYKPDDETVEFVNLTPGTLGSDGYHTDGDVSGDLGLLNFSGVPNGIYDLVLWVRGGGDEAQAVARIDVESELKLGELKFSEQDMVIPANGIPLTIVRSYDSLNPNQGDFGYGWTMALNDLDARLDETRIDVNAEFDLNSSEADISTPLINVREGGNRNVTLTLPNGKRTTFVFVPRMSGSGPFAYAEWTNAPGVSAKLTMYTPVGDNTISAVSDGFGVPVWSAGDPRTPFDQFDIPGFDLTLLDGTVYELRRDPVGTSYIDPNGDGNYPVVQPYPDRLTPWHRKAAFWAKVPVVTRLASHALDLIGFETADRAVGVR